MISINRIMKNCLKEDELIQMAVPYPLPFMSLTSGLTTVRFKICMQMVMNLPRIQYRKFRNKYRNLPVLYPVLVVGATNITLAPYLATYNYIYTYLCFTNRFCFVFLPLPFFLSSGFLYLAHLHNHMHTS